MSAPAIVASTRRRAASRSRQATTRWASQMAGPWSATCETYSTIRPWRRFGRSRFRDQHVPVPIRSAFFERDDVVDATGVDFLGILATRQLEGIRPQPTAIRPLGRCSRAEQTDGRQRPDNAVAGTAQRLQIDTRPGGQLRRRRTGRAVLRWARRPKCSHFRRARLRRRTGPGRCPRDTKGSSLANAAGQSPSGRAGPRGDQPASTRSRSCWCRGRAGSSSS